MMDNEVTKALLRCITTMDCSKCSYDNGKNCVEKLLEDANNIINRQKAEIERLQNHIKNSFDDLLKQILEKEIKTAKSEVVKEFAHFIIDKEQNGVIYSMDILDYVIEFKTRFDHPDYGKEYGK